MELTTASRRWNEEDTALLAVLGPRVKHLREERGFASPIAFVRAHPEVGMGHSVLSSLERGGYIPRLSRALAVAAALGVTLSELVGDIAEDPTYKAGYRDAIVDMHEALRNLSTKE